MKILQIAFQAVTVLLIAVLAFVYFSNKDEITRLNEAREALASEVGVEENTFARNVEVTLENLNQTRQDLRAAEATNTGLTNQLDKTRSDLEGRTAELQQARQELRLANNELTTTKETVTSLRSEVSQAKRDVENERQSRIQIQQSRLADTKRIEELTAELASARLEIQSLKDGTMLASGPSAETGTTPGIGNEDRVAELEAEVRRLRNQIASIESNPALAGLVALAGETSRATGTGSSVEISSLSISDGLVVLTPKGDSVFEPQTTLNLLDRGINLANVRLISVFPNYLVGEILPSSPQAKNLAKGLVLDTRQLSL